MLPVPLKINLLDYFGYAYYFYKSMHKIKDISLWYNEHLSALLILKKKNKATKRVEKFQGRATVITRGYQPSPFCTNLFFKKNQVFKLFTHSFFPG